MASDVSPEELTSALQELTLTINDILQFSQDTTKESVEEFVNSKIGKMFGMATAYQKCMKRINVGTKAELEKTISTLARYPKVRDAGEELLECEHLWDRFLLDIDKSLGQDTSEALIPGQPGPIQFDVTDAGSGLTTTLAQQLTGTDNLVLVLLRHFA